MKKLLIATAALAMVAGTAQAQSSVTVYGVVDIGITELTTDTTDSGGVTTSVKQKTTGNGGAYSSQRLGFRGTEDLGGGLKANFVYELGINDSDANASAVTVDGGTDTAAPMATRVATVGLSGSFGAIDIGRQTTIADKAWGVGDVGGGNSFFGRAYTSSGKLNNSRSDRLINYTSPKMSGFSVQVAYGVREEPAFGTTDEWKETGLGIAYSAGKLNVMLGISKEEGKLNGAAVTDAKPEQMVLGANYDFGVAKAFLTYATADNQSSAGATVNDKKVTEIGAAIPFGKTTLQLSAFDGENKPTTTTKSDLSGYQVGVLHAFSKRTTAYAVYGVDEVATSGALDKVERDQFGFGVRHSF
jgi:predicted porin